MKALFLVFHGFAPYNGISKKIAAQVRGLKECGVDTRLCYYQVQEDGSRQWKVGDEVLIELGSGVCAKLRKRFDFSSVVKYVREHQISFVYIRSDHNANPFTIWMVRQFRRCGARVVMEIPTYPYDQEYITLESKLYLQFDKLFRRSLAKNLNGIITFSDAEEIFGQRTIRISNGVDFSTIRLKQNQHIPSELHLLGVAEIHYWHGFDRVIEGLAAYYRANPEPSCKVFFHIVGEFSGNRERHEICEPIEQSNLSEYVILHGRLSGEPLAEMFDRADVGIGSLGRHRSNISCIKTLKNREYAARGIPFVYSETDTDFDRMPYVLKFPADESPVDIHRIIDFYNNLSVPADEIRDSIRHLSWKEQMKKVLDIICA